MSPTLRLRWARRIALWASIGLLPPALASCADVSRFSTEPGESFCGVVVDASFVRAGIRAGTRMRLQLDAERLRDAPGQLWTDPLEGGTAFVATPLEGIPQLQHDSLSVLSFGEGRVKNTIVNARLGEADVLVVISLMQTGEVEVRLLRGAGKLFGVFRLQRERGTCGL